MFNSISQWFSNPPPTSQINTSSQNEKLHVIFFGNPGSGKSTLLNSLIGNKVFENGFSFITGLTKLFETFQANDSVIYCDTPGLADVKTRNEAAKQIEMGLKQGGRFKIFFVVQMRNGRIINEDLATMFTILKAIGKKRPNLKYGIVFNGLSRREFAVFANPSTQQRVMNEMKNALFSNCGNEDLSGFATDKFLAIPQCDNVEWGLPAFISNVLKQFVDSVGEITINSSEIENLKMDTSKFESWIEFFSKKMWDFGILMIQIWEAIPLAEKQKILFGSAGAAAMALNAASIIYSSKSEKKNISEKK